MNIIEYLKEKKQKNIEQNENIEITIVDNDTELPDFRKITVPDLKQYLIKGYDEIREVKKEKEILKEDLEKAKKFEDLYNSELVVLNEFKERDEENKIIQIKLENKINEKETEIKNLKKQVNTYRIIEIETNKKIDNIEKIKKEEKNNSIKEYKEKLIEEINNTKGTISKSKLFSMINSIK